MKDKIVLIGGGGHCHSVIDVIEQEGKFEIIGIIDKKEFFGKEVLGYKVIGTDDDLPDIFRECNNAIITIGQIESCIVRKNIFIKLKELGFTLPIIVSPFAYVSKYSKIKEGTVILHQALVNANAKIGSNCIINTKALIEHDAIIENNCHISTSSVVNGNVHIKEGNFYGSNATSKQSIVIDSFTKAGSLVK